MEAVAVPQPRERTEHHLPTRPDAVGVARRLAREFTGGFLAREIVADLELVISEVITNAVRHGGAGEIVFAMTPKPDVLCVQVTDDGEGFVPAPHAMDTDETGGFGLFLVEQLTRRWGMTRERGCTRVWFEMRLTQ